MVNNPSNKVKSESIDEVIIRLLGLKPGVELDYQTYFEIIKKKLFIVSLAKKELTQEENELLRSELKRVRAIKEQGKRFKVRKRKTKVKFSSSTGAQKVGQKKLPGSSAIARYKGASIVSTAIKPVNVEDITEESKEKKTEFVGIRKTLDSILKTLASKFKFDQKQADADRKEKETQKRGRGESALEGFKKGIGAIVETTKKMLSPLQNVIDRIKKFIFFTLLGRAFTKFMEWMSDKGNQEKFNSFIEFLSDHWPALAGLYILFGTSFGKLIRGLLKGTARMIVALAMSIPKIFNFIKKNKKLSFLALAAAPLVTREVGNLFVDKPTPESGLIPNKIPELDSAQKSLDQSKDIKVPKFNFGGIIPQFNLGGMLPSFISGGMDFSQGLPITGAGKDDTLIAAKTGEAILTEQDQQDIGQRYVERNTGEPLNIPQYLAGRRPGMVSMGNIKPKFGGGFNLGGIIPKFNTGGIVGMKGGSGIKSTPDLSLLKPQAKAIFDRLIKGGLSKSAAAGIVANIGVETGYTYNPSTMQRGGGPGRGLVQWESGGRFDTDNINLMSFAKSRKSNWNDLNTQVDFILHELNNHPEYQIVKGKLNNAKSAEEATMIFLRDYEKAGTPHTKDRLKVLKQIQFAGYLNPPKPKPTDKPKPKTKPSSGNIFSNFASFMPSSFPLKGGGLVKESSGMDIPGATADRQLTALQPGEYVLPLDTVVRLGGPSVIDRLVAMTDTNSNPFKEKSINRPKITPYNTSYGSGMSGAITLPPITTSAGGATKARSAGYAGGSEVPSFAYRHPNGNHQMHADIYGIIGG